VVGPDLLLGRDVELTEGGGQPTARVLLLLCLVCFQSLVVGLRRLDLLAGSRGGATLAPVAAQVRPGDDAAVEGFWCGRLMINTLL
jgi:hypothetical protein